jgi:uncharacterized protein YdcH (DUF465 family)
VQIEHHDLHHEFPEYKERIRYLKMSNAHFAKLFTEYDLLDHGIRAMENQGSPVADSEMESMKLKRVRLKDELFAYLNMPI